MKKCTICKLEKSLDEFNKHSGRKDGKQPHCRKCNKERSKNYYRNNHSLHKKNVAIRNKKYRQEIYSWIIEYLKCHPCVKCGFDDIRTLEFDHVGTKSYNISTMIKNLHSISSIEKEIKQCQVLCANCHRIKTSEDFGWYKN